MVMNVPLSVGQMNGPNIPKRFRCWICRKKHTNIADLDRHMLKRHVDNGNSLSETDILQQNQMEAECKAEVMEKKKTKKGLKRNTSKVRKEPITKGKNITRKIKEAKKVLANEKLIIESLDKADQDEIIILRKKFGKPSMCYLCFKFCNDANDLSNHLLMKHKKESLKCKKCRIVFHLHEKLEIHYLKVHKKISTDSGETTEDCKKIDINENFEITDLDKGSLKMKLNESIEIEYSGNESQKNEQNESQSINESQNIQQNESIVIEDSDSEDQINETDPKINIIPGLKKKAMGKKAKCEVCGLVLSNAFTLRRHVRNKHLGAKNSNTVKLQSDNKNIEPPTNGKMDKLGKSKIKTKCEICGLILASRTGMKRHVQRIHNKLEISNASKQECVYQCLKCSKVFKLHVALNIHAKNCN